MLEPENRVPDCLYMALKGRAKLRPSQATALQPHPIELLLTINFNEQWEDVGIGRVKFGLSGGELRLHLENGRIPYDHRHLKGKLALTIEKQRQDKVSHKAQHASKGSLSVTATAVAEPKLTAEASTSQEAAQERAETYPITACQVTTKGTETEPAWVFEVKTGDPILKGTLTHQDLATLLATASDWQLQATFAVPLQDVRITAGEGLWLQNLTPEKREALDIALAKLLLKRKLKPYLSRMKLRHV